MDLLFKFNTLRDIYFVNHFSRNKSISNSYMFSACSDPNSLLHNSHSLEQGNYAQTVIN